MEKSYKFRIYPNKKQEELLKNTFGCVRYVYNYYLNRKIELYKKYKKSINYSALSRSLTVLKRKNEWLKVPDKCALQNTLKDLDIAYKNFFNGRAKFPKFKSKKLNRYSYRTNSNIKYLGDRKIKLPKLGIIRLSKDKMIPKGRILNATISYTPSGKYFVSLCCTDVEIKPLVKSKEYIGIDLGISDFAIMSNGLKIQNPKHLNKSLKKLARLQKELSRKTIGSKNRNKARIKVAKMYEKISNQRTDFLNKLTTEIIKRYDVVCLETLKIKNMIKNRKLSRSISDVSWGEFIRQLEYKSKWYCKKIIKIDTFFASSQICSSCGCKNEEVKNLQIREWTCKECGSNHDRDINASINILKQGLKELEI